MKDCPIGFICEYFECNRRTCQNLARPWTLPYSNHSIDPEWRATWGFLVEIPGYNHDYHGDEEDEELHRYNAWVESIRHELWRCGWWEANKLPYCPHPDGGLLVTAPLRMEQSVTLACHLDYTDDLDGFEPPVPIHGYQRLYGELPIFILNENWTKGQITFENYCLLYANSFLSSFDELYPLNIL